MRLKGTDCPYTYVCGITTVFLCALQESEMFSGDTDLIVMQIA